MFLGYSIKLQVKRIKKFSLTSALADVRELVIVIGFWKLKLLRLEHTLSFKPKQI